MARPLRIAFPGAAYHLISRGNDRQAVFRGDQDRELFYEVLGLVVARFAWRVHSYCLMGNHYHLLVETPRGNVSGGMRHLNGVFAQRLNRRRGRSGHLFEGRFTGILVESERHLRDVVAYVANNPVRAGLCERASDWSHGSFRALLGLAAPRAFLTTTWVLGLFGDTPVAASRRLRLFVEGVDAPTPVLIADSYACSEDFVREVVGDREPVPEVARREWQPLPVPLAEIFARERFPVATAYRRCGYTLREIGEHVGCHYATVSRRLRREESELDRDAA